MVKLTTKQAEFLERIKEDGGLMRCAEGYSFLDGSTAHARVVHGLINKGKLVDNGDTLFEGIESQTMRAT